MVKILYSLLAEGAVFSKSNNLTIFEIFNEITAEQLPAVQLRTFFVCFGQFEAEEAGTVREWAVSISAPDGNTVARPFGSITLPTNAKSDKITLNIQIPVIPLPVLGRYEFRLTIDGHDASTAILDVIQ